MLRWYWTLLRRVSRLLGDVFCMLSMRSAAKKFLKDRICAHGPLLGRCFNSLDVHFATPVRKVLIHIMQLRVRRWRCVPRHCGSIEDEFRTLPFSLIHTYHLVTENDMLLDDS